MVVLAWWRSDSCGQVTASDQARDMKEEKVEERNRC